MAAARDRHGRKSAHGAPFPRRPTVSGSRSGRSVERCRRHGHLTLPTELYRRTRPSIRCGGAGLALAPPCPLVWGRPRPGAAAGSVLDTAHAGRAPSRSSGSRLPSSASPLGKRPKGHYVDFSRRERTLASNSVREGTGCRSLEPNERGGAVRRRRSGHREARRRSPARTPRPASRAARASGSRVERRSRSAVRRPPGTRKLQVASAAGHDESQAEESRAQDKLAAGRRARIGHGHAVPAEAGRRAAERIEKTNYETTSSISRRSPTLRHAHAGAPGPRGEAPEARQAGLADTAGRRAGLEPLRGVEHAHPMLSRSNAFDEAEFRAFDQRVRNASASRTHADCRSIADPLGPRLGPRVRNSAPRQANTRG